MITIGRHLPWGCSRRGQHIALVVKRGHPPKPGDHGRFRWGRRHPRSVRDRLARVVLGVGTEFGLSARKLNAGSLSVRYGLVQKIIVLAENIAP